jgi:hypothetical protein
MAKRKTNVQIVKHMMEFSNHGALAQLFIIQAIEQYAKQMSSLTPEQVKKFDNAFISGEAWQSVAVEIKTTLEKHYNS